MLRIKPGVDAHTHDFVKTGQIDSKFGFALENGEAFDIIKKATEYRNIKIDGIMTIFFCKTVKKYLYNYGSVSLDNFGKTVFLSREDAEAKLKGGAE